MSSGSSTSWSSSFSDHPSAPVANMLAASHDMSTNTKHVDDTVAARIGIITPSAPVYLVD